MQPGLLMAAASTGILRGYLISAMGVEGARMVLTQLGYAQGWRIAEAVQDEYGRRRGLSKAGVVVGASDEAELHLRDYGQADEPVCWALCGLTSGFLSRSEGEDIFVLENRCRGVGDGTCFLVGRTREEWGPERASNLDYFDPECLRARLTAATDPVSVSLRHAEELLAEQRQIGVPPRPENELGVVANSPTMRRLVGLARRVGPIASAVLITGEEGTGTASIARLIHENSTRAGGPFLSVHCVGRHEEELEMELFGSVASDSPGRTDDRPGQFEAARNGTLWLDGIGALSLALQTRVLRALQDREIQRVFDQQTRRVDVRIVASTHEDLAHRVLHKSFLMDLYYRLKVVTLHIPALRDRTADIVPLATGFLAKAVRRLKLHQIDLNPEATAMLLRYPWPGNMQELEAAMEHGCALSVTDTLTPGDLPAVIRQPKTPRVASLHEVERAHILTALERNDGNRSRTARQLGIASATLYRKLKHYGVAKST